MHPALTSTRGMVSVLTTRCAMDSSPTTRCRISLTPSVSPGKVYKGVSANLKSLEATTATANGKSLKIIYYQGLLRSLATTVVANIFHKRCVITNALLPLDLFCNTSAWKEISVNSWLGERGQKSTLKLWVRALGLRV